MKDNLEVWAVIAHFPELGSDEIILFSSRQLAEDYALIEAAERFEGEYDTESYGAWTYHFQECGEIYLRPLTVYGELP